MQTDNGIALIAYDGSDDAATAIRQAGHLLGPRRAIVAHVWDSLAALLLHTDIRGLTGSMRETADELDERIAAMPSASRRKALSWRAMRDSTPRRTRYKESPKPGQRFSRRPTSSTPPSL